MIWPAVFDHIMALISCKIQYNRHHKKDPIKYHSTLAHCVCTVLWHTCRVSFWIQRPGHSKYVNHCRMVELRYGNGNFLMAFTVCSLLADNLTVLKALLLSG